MTTIDPTTIIVGPAGQTLAEAAAAEQADLYVGGYQVRPRPCGSLPPGATRSPSGYIVLADGTSVSYYGADVQAELLALADERGRGETLAVDGDAWGSAHVVVSHPRARERGFLAVSFDEARYPALADACRVCTPNDADGPASPAVPSASEQLVRETIDALDAAIAAHGSGHDRVTRLDPTPEGWTPVVLEARTVESARRIATEAIAFSVAHSGVRRGDPEAWWDGSATRGRVRLLVPGDERLQLAEDLARRAGDDAEREHDESVASLPEGRHYTRCCDAAREDGERNEYAFAMALSIEALRRRHAAVGGGS